MRKSKIGAILALGMLIMPSFAIAASKAVSTSTESVRIAKSANELRLEDAELTVLQQVTSNKDRAEYAQKTEDEIRYGLSDLQKKVEVSRKSKDIVSLNCLNEKFTSVNALLKIAQSANSLMSEAMGLNNPQQIEHQFKRVVIARFKSRVFLKESDLCQDSGDSSQKNSTSSDTVVGVQGSLTGSTSEKNLSLTGVSNVGGVSSSTTNSFTTSTDVSNEVPPVPDITEEEPSSK